MYMSGSMHRQWTGWLPGGPGLARPSRLNPSEFRFSKKSRIRTGSLMRTWSESQEIPSNILERMIMRRSLEHARVPRP